ncbi:MAG: ethanolamine ammonia-lyase subunit EutC [Pseudomonadota bacterium]
MTDMQPGAAPPPDPWAELRRHTPARIALGRSGTSLPTHELLRFAAAHAQAQDAVHVALDVPALQAALAAAGWAGTPVHSRAADRHTYLRRPDLGRRLAPDSADALQAGASGPVDLAIVLGDGLSAVALQRHGLPLLQALRSALDGRLRLASPVIASQARVALGDEIGALLQARLVLVLLGERPGLSAPDSLGAYLTHAPHVGCHDAQRNCVSNIRPDGLPPAVAAQRLAWLATEALRRRLTGIGLKDDSSLALLNHRVATPPGPPP